MPKTTVVAAKSGGGGKVGGTTEHQRGKTCRRRRGRRRGGATKLGWGVKEQHGGAKKKRKEVQREHRAPSVLWLERNPSGTGERRSEGFRGAEEESILLNSHASWRRGRTRRKERARG